MEKEYLTLSNICLYIWISNFSTLGPRDTQSQRRRDATTPSHKFEVIEHLDAELVLKGRCSSVYQNEAKGIYTHLNWRVRKHKVWMKTKFYQFQRNIISTLCIQWETFIIAHKNIFRSASRASVCDRSRRPPTPGRQKGRWQLGSLPTGDASGLTFPALGKSRSFRSFNYFLRLFIWALRQLGVFFGVTNFSLGLVAERVEVEQ